MRHVATHDCHCRMAYGRELLKQAVHDCVFNVLPEDCGGIIAVNPHGEYTFPFNTPGMFRAVYSNVGDGLDTAKIVQEVGIWEEMLPV
jgi:isoaspartyl peptidase/L-asparaginase-like protein (Ntn-hydrolase superfamily)